MQDALSAFVLNSETLRQRPMNEAPINPATSPAQAEPQRPCLSDERLMLAFLQRSSEAFTELFHRYKQPVYGFFCRRVSDPANAEELTQKRFSPCFEPRHATNPAPSFALISTPSVSKFSAPTAAKPPFAGLFWATATRFSIPRNPSPPGRAQQDAVHLGSREVRRHDSAKIEITILLIPASRGNLATQNVARSPLPKNVGREADFCGIL